MLIPTVSHALPPMQWALAAAKRLECGSLLPLCFYAQTTCLSPYPIFPISPMTGHATRFDPANRATEHTPVGCGEESPRSCRRVGNRNGGWSAAVLGRINPTTDPTTRFDSVNRTTEHTPVGCGEESPRSCRRVGNRNGGWSAAVLGRINPKTDPMPRLDHANAASEHSPAGDTHTPCLSPYRHPRGSSTDLDNRRLEQEAVRGPCRNQGQNPNNEPVTLLGSAPRQ